MKASYQLARNHAALLDLEAEGRIRIAGAGAEAALNACFSMDLEIIHPWRGVTGLFLNEEASVLAIATVFRADDEFFVFTEAASAARLLAHLREALAGADARIEDLSDAYGWIGLLGPKAQAAMAELAGEEVLGLPYQSFEENQPLQATLFRMGFCGEFEYRVLVPRARIHELAERLLDGGRPFGVDKAPPDVMCVLMLEMRSLGFADIPPGGDPIQCGLHWMVNFRKPQFVGRDALMAAKEAAPQRALMVRLEPAGSARAGDRLRIEGRDLGQLAHVDYSPVLEQDIALAYVDADLGWVGVTFDAKVAAGSCLATGVSAPLFVTKTISGT